MKIAIIGASAGIGLEVTRLALQKGHEVSTLSRRVVPLPDHPNLRRVQGSATNLNDVRAVVAGAEVIHVTLGTKSPFPTTMFSDSARLLLQALQETGSSATLLVLTGFGAGDSWSYNALPMRILFTLLLKTVYADKSEQERLIAEAQSALQQLRVEHNRVQEQFHLPRPEGVPIDLTPQQLKRGAAEFAFRPFLHDDGTKEFLGNKGNFAGEDIIGILVGNPRTAYYITEKIWNWFCYPDPEKSLVERHAAKFRESGLDIKVLLRSIMESSEFYSDKAQRAVYKNPVDFVVSTVRQLGVGESLATQLQGVTEAPRPQLLPAVAAQQTMKAMGMELFFPPDVSGWDGGPAWISSATMVERIEWADRIFGVAGQAGAAPGKGQGFRGQRAQIRLPAYGLFTADPSPQGVVDKLVSVFDAPIGAGKRSQLLAAAQKASGGQITAQNANQVAAAVTRLIFGSPEFQMA